MKNSTLCYLERGGCLLMLHRTKKETDENKGKWIGVGGKLEEGESPEEGAAREVLEETGYTLLSSRYRGIVTFVSDEWGTEYMHLFTSDHFCGKEIVCEEGDLAWIPKEELFSLPMWEGDRIFLRLLDQDIPFFSLKLTYRGDTLVKTSLNGKALPLPADVLGKQKNPI
ncbi:NUDIX hydrolase [Anaeromassilibacillus sp. An200]|uniref:NUDIX hydrolase n=1 Tax=Anaeromassilibacillus sp. An200 TaxID=1965587 RepID=UPI000B398454|nr:8-oxo-dGTP diphosphatase [Anaeromassilibacillus sp. An200]OUP12697.1 DNA mismatch repair protein MutT [Anaeromassilibacillus sp. An200]